MTDTVLSLQKGNVSDVVNYNSTTLILVSGILLYWRRDLSLSEEKPKSVVELVCGCGDIYDLKRANDNLYKAECLGCNNNYYVIVENLDEEESQERS